MKNKWFIEPYITKQEIKANKALDVVGEYVRTEAKVRVPVDTENLQDSIVTDKEHLAVGIGTNVEYGPYVEYGTEKMGAQPYLGPSIEDHATLQRLFTKAMSK